MLYSSRPNANRASPQKSIALQGQKCTTFAAWRAHFPACRLLNKAIFACSSSPLVIQIHTAAFCVHAYVNNAFMIMITKPLCATRVICGSERENCVYMWAFSWRAGQTCVATRSRTRACTHSDRWALSLFICLEIHLGEWKWAVER